MSENEKAGLESKKLDDSVLEAVSGGASGGARKTYISIKDPSALLYNNPADSGWGNYAVAGVLYGNIISSVSDFNSEWKQVPVASNLAQISMIKTHWFDPRKGNGVMYVRTRDIKPYAG